MIRYVTPYALDGNLAGAYNYEMSISTPDDYVAFVDRDTTWMDPKYGHKIAEIVEENGPAYYTGYTNRVACGWQVYEGADWSNNDWEYHREITNEVWERNGHRVEDRTDAQLWSGFLMVCPVGYWEPLTRPGLLGVDNDIHVAAKRQGLPILQMTGIYLPHYYRGGNRSDKSHLKL